MCRKFDPCRGHHHTDERIARFFAEKPGFFELERHEDRHLAMIPPHLIPGNAP